MLFFTQVINLLTQSELSVVLSNKLLQPRTFMVKPTQSLFVSGLGRIDYVEVNQWNSQANVCMYVCKKYVSMYVGIHLVLCKKRSILSSGLLKAHYTLLPWQTYSIVHHLNFSGKHLAKLQLMREGCLYKYPPLSKAR